MRLGYIDYLNCFPFYYHLFEKRSLSNVEIFPARPNVLNEWMAKGLLNMSPISAATCAEISDRVVLLPDFCLSSVGYVGSVLLVSSLPIENLHGKDIAVTRASHTSVVLLKTLMKKYYHVEPVYVQGDVVPDSTTVDALLIIGNEAMKYRAASGYRVYDLGELWLEKSGFPIVFAAFAIGREAAKCNLEEIRAITLSFYRSLSCLTTDKARLIELAHGKYPDIDYDLDAYYDYLKFYFTDELKEALDFFCRSAREEGFLEMPAPLEFLDFN